MVMWDGRRWIYERRADPRTAAGRRTRDWIATGIMGLALVALVFPSLGVRADVGELMLEPAQGVPGSIAVARVVGGPPHTNLQLTWDGVGVSMPSGRTSAAGELALRFLVPAAAPGEHLVSAIGSNARGELDVLSPGYGLPLNLEATFLVRPTASQSAEAPLRRAEADARPGASVGQSKPEPTASPSAVEVSTSPLPSPFVALVTPLPRPKATHTPEPTPAPAIAPAPAPTPPPPPAPTPTAAPVAPAPPPTFVAGRPAMPAGALWADQFDGAGLDPARWGWDMAMVGTGDNMNRYAMFSTDPRLLEVSGGTLKLKALQEPDGRWLQSYISTRDKFSQQYGIFRASMKIPAGHALWPAFWMLDPTRYDEMDVIEAYPQPGNATYTFCMHYQGGSPCQGMPLPADHASAFHVYEMEWRPGVAIARLDGVEVARHAIPEMRPQFLLLQMAVGVWFKDLAPDGTTPKNPALEVDWVATWP